MNMNKEQFLKFLSIINKQIDLNPSVKEIEIEDKEDIIEVNLIFNSYSITLPFKKQ